MKYRIIWRGNEIGKLADPVPDMWYLEGNWKSNDSNESKEFEQLAETFKAKNVLSNYDQGTRIELIDENDQSVNALVISLADSILFVRRITEKEAIEWLIKNVK